MNVVVVRRWVLVVVCDVDVPRKVDVDTVVVGNWPVVGVIPVGVVDDDVDEVDVVMDVSDVQTSSPCVRHFCRTVVTQSRSAGRVQRRSLG
jgi:hypothetical protein